MDNSDHLYRAVTMTDMLNHIIALSKQKGIAIGALRALDAEFQDYFRQLPKEEAPHPEFLKDFSMRIKLIELQLDKEIQKGK